MPEPGLRSGPIFKGMRIGLLGGSFNPAHEGHLAASLHALRQLRLNQIWWLVSPQNPLKSPKEMASLANRMLLARQIARHPRIYVTDLEIRLGTRYTIDTLRRLHERFPATHFVWLMGADNLQQIPKWRKGLDIFSVVPVAVLRRPTYPAGRRSGKAAQRFERVWRSASRAASLAGTSPPGWVVLNNRYDTHSATAIRKNKKGKG